MDQTTFIIFQILVVLFSVVLHEVAHGAIANGLGDPTAKNLGRLTLNPFKHLDLFGSVILPLLTFYAGGFIFGYAKPVPYNPYGLRDRKYGPAKVAAAGPLTNIAVAVMFGALLRADLPIFTWSLMPQLFAFIVFINLTLAIFNLMPIPPLDGHWLVLTFLPDRYYTFKRIYMQMGFVFLIIFIFFLFPFIFPLITGLYKLIVGVPFSGFF